MRYRFATTSILYTTKYHWQFRWNWHFLRVSNYEVNYQTDRTALIKGKWFMLSKHAFSTFSQHCSCQSECTFCTACTAAVRRWQSPLRSGSWWPYPSWSLRSAGVRVRPASWILSLGKRKESAGPSHVNRGMFIELDLSGQGIVPMEKPLPLARTDLFFLKIFINLPRASMM